MIDFEVAPNETVRLAASRHDRAWVGRYFRLGSSRFGLCPAFQVSRITGLRATRLTLDIVARLLLRSGLHLGLSAANGKQTAEQHAPRTHAHVCPSYA